MVEMTDEELGKAIVETWRTTSSGYAVVGACARALLAKPMATREAAQRVIDDLDGRQLTAGSWIDLRDLRNALKGTDNDQG